MAELYAAIVLTMLVGSIFMIGYAIGYYWRRLQWMRAQRIEERLTRRQQCLHDRYTPPRPATYEDLLRISTQLERTMVNNTRTLIEAVKQSETKLDGYVSIVNASNVAILAAIGKLQSLKDEPTSDEIGGVITELQDHLTAAGTAVESLAQSSKALATEPGKPEPVGNPLPTEQPAQT